MSEPVGFHPEIDRRAELHEAIKRADHVVLEVGPGPYPYLDGQFDTHGQRSVYIGWNIDPRQHKILTDEYADHNKFALLAKPPGHTGPEPSINEFLEPGTIDEVIFANVLGEPDSGLNFRGRPALNPSGEDYRGSSPIASRFASLEAAADFLKPGGTLTVIETVTPAHEFPDFEVKPAAIKLLEQHGLEIMYSLEKRNPEDRAELATELQHYGNSDADAADNSYIVHAHKPRSRSS